jgi:hypothetical protein
MTERHVSCWLIFLFASSVLGSFAAHAQGNGKSVADGVYTDVQATRGAAAYDGACGRCHRQDLGGADGPALKDDRFNRNFAGHDLKTLYTRIATTMPRGAPGSMAEGVYLDVLAHILRENGFPAGPQELNSEILEGVQVLPTRPKPLPPVGDFSYVEVVGCLTPGAEGTWILAKATDPVAVAPDKRSLTSGQAAGSHSFHLLDALAYNPQAHVGHKMYVRGLLIRLPTEQRMSISAMETVAPSCE